MKKLLIIISLIILTIISLFIEKDLSNLIINNRIDFLNQIFIVITYAGPYITFFLTTLFLFSKNKKNYMLAFWLSFLITILILEIIKIGVARPRPELTALVKATGYSFPSMHTALAFLPLIFIDNKKWRLFWFIFALLVAFSRLYLGVHYLSEVLAGALIAYLVGYITLTIERKYKLLANLIDRIKY